MPGNTEKVIRSYGKIYAVGHRAVHKIFTAPVLAEEKVDGSQFSMGVRNGELFCRSRNMQLDTANPEGLFKEAVETAKAVASHMVDGWTYRGEYLKKPRHNSLIYARTPIRHIVLFDVDKGNQDYVSWEEKEDIAVSLGLEVIPRLWEGRIEGPEHITALLQGISFLGGAIKEGIVFKSYDQYGADGKVLMAKYVSEAFKETHRKVYKQRNPGPTDIKQQIIETYRTSARWEKAVQHLRDDGRLVGAPEDIGPLMRELNKDIEEECMSEIAADLLKWAKKDILRGCARGFAEWYKEKLVKDAADAGAFGSPE